jgi:hypothetical protein
VNWLCDLGDLDPVTQTELNTRCEEQARETREEFLAHDDFEIPEHAA